MKGAQNTQDIDPFVETDEVYEESLTLDELIQTSNIATLLSEDDLVKIGKEVVEGYTNDLDSRRPWEENLEKWTKLALQITEPKTFPWPNAANIKFPLLSTAAMQFAARAYPTLVPSNGQIVKCRSVGYDPTGEKAQRADRLSKHMSYQVIDQMPDWEEDMDKLLLALPISGTCFKKTYWDSAKQVNVSKLILPKFLVVNYSARSLEDAERVTEVIYLTKRQVKERTNKEIFLDRCLGTPTESQTMTQGYAKAANQLEASEDETTPYPFLEQHCFLDLDGDGYTEPYIVTVEENSQQVVRIVSRFSEESVLMKEDKVISIEADQYYTKYSFIPNPDGGFYDLGFGRLLGPINESANTIINQLVDAGSLSNLQAGFIGKGLRIKMGQERFQPGEWKVVNATGDDIKKQILPLPTNAPNEVLFKLLDLLLKSGKELASVAEIFVGKMPGQNTPATTTMATIEQGMKVFTAVYKRIYRSLTKEFRKIYKLNKQYMNPEEYIAVLDINMPQQDYEGPEDDIIPGADPTAISGQEKQARAQAIMQILNLGTIDPMKATQAYLDAHDIPAAETFLKQPSPPPPDPKIEAMKMKAQIDQQKAQNDIMISREKLRMEQMTQEQKSQNEGRAQQVALEGKQMEGILKGQEAQQRMAVSADEHRQSLQQTHDNHLMGMVHANAQAKQKMQHAAQAQKQQPKKVSKEK